MSPSEFALTVDSADPLAELMIVDARYTTRGRGLGKLVCKVPPGLYVVRARSGEQTQKKTVRVSNGPVSVSFGDRGDLRSSALVDQSFEQARVNIVNSASRTSPNADAWVVLALRQAVESGTTPAYLPVQSASGFELLPTTSTNAIQFGNYPLLSTPTGHWVVALQIPQGWYELSIPGDNDSRIRMPLYASPAFSPSVFVELRAESNGPQRPDLDRLLVSYDDREFEIFRNNDRMRAIELARRSLVLGRNMLTPALMDFVFQQKYRDPIFGLFAAYLLLSDPNGEKHFTEVVHNTGDILQYPQFPDLVIARALGRQKGWLKSTKSYAGDDDPLIAPPLLRASWDGMLTLKDRNQEVVATPRLRSIASTLIRSNVWVLWRPSSTTVSTSAPRRKSTAGPDALFRGLVDRLRTEPDLASTLRDYEGGKLFRAIAHTALEVTAESGFEVPRHYMKRLAAALSVPVPLIADEIRTISDALGAKKKP